MTDLNKERNKRRGRTVKCNEQGEDKRSRSGLLEESIELVKSILSN